MLLCVSASQGLFVLFSCLVCLGELVNILVYLSCYLAVFHRDDPIYILIFFSVLCFCLCCFSWSCFLFLSKPGLRHLQIFQVFSITVARHMSCTLRCLVDFLFCLVLGCLCVSRMTHPWVSVFRSFLGLFCFIFSLVSVPFVFVGSDLFFCVLVFLYFVLFVYQVVSVTRRFLYWCWYL